MSRHISLNNDVLSNILRYMPISDLDILLYATQTEIEEEDKQKLKATRQNPIPYLKQLVDNPLELLDYMSKCRIILSGSRASEFFYPGVTESDSDWDFYSLADIGSVVIFSTYLQMLGVNWQEGQISNPEVLEYNQNLNNCFYVIQGTMDRNNREYKIQLIVSQVNSLNLASHLISFHSSIVQCFISGVCAGSLYHKSSREYTSLRWSTKKYQGHPDISPISAVCIKKYLDRGINYISYETYLNKYNTKNKNLPMFLARLYRYRLLGDRESYFISFRPYLHNEMTNTLFRSLTCMYAKQDWTESANYITTDRRSSEGVLINEELVTYIYNSFNTDIHNNFSNIMKRVSENNYFSKYPAEETPDIEIGPFIDIILKRLPYLSLNIVSTLIGLYKRIDVYA